MKDAALVVEEIGEALREVDEQIRNHPFPRRSPGARCR